MTILLNLKSKKSTHAKNNQIRTPKGTLLVPGIQNKRQNKNDDEEEKKMNKSELIEKTIFAAKNNYGLPSHGIIYKVLTGFMAKLNSPYYVKDGQIMTEKQDEADHRAYREKYIDKDSLIEFRYECYAHCRDADNEYWCIDPCVLALKCEPFAKIDGTTRWENKLNLKEILEQEKYILIEDELETNP